MEQIERIPVYIDFVGGKTRCICRQDNKMCGKACKKDVVDRDKFRNWEDTNCIDRYGNWRGKNDD